MSKLRALRFDLLAWIALVAVWELGGIFASSKLFRDLWALVNSQVMWVSCGLLFWAYGRNNVWLSIRPHAGLTALRIGGVITLVFATTTFVQRIRFPDEDFEILLIVVTTIYWLPSLLLSLFAFFAALCVRRRTTK